MLQGHDMIGAHRQQSTLCPPGTTEADESDVDSDMADALDTMITEGLGKPNRELMTEVDGLLCSKEKKLFTRTTMKTV